MERAAGIEKVFEHFPQAGRDSLIPILQAVQEEEGYLSEAAVVGISRHLGIPASKVYGVATFYNQFRFQPKGKYHILLCRGTACHVKGSAKVLEAVMRYLKIEPGRTTRDKLFSLETVACMGACALSPVLCINDEFYAKVSPAKAVKLIDACRAQELSRPVASA
jgi:NADH-quinone oxidoreductase E subunit